VRQGAERGRPGDHVGSDRCGQEGRRRDVEARLRRQDAAQRPRRSGHHPARGGGLRRHQRRSRQRRADVPRTTARREGASQGAGREDHPRPRARL
ncbi:MAG: hypothetical protein AVDCRST_MAG34-1369, partial [uncultured Nocardioidaceae bacterium]